MQFINLYYIKKFIKNYVKRFLCGEKMDKWGELLITIILLVVGIIWIIYWWNDFLLVLKGTIGAILLVFGVLFLLITIEDFKE